MSRFAASSSAASALGLTLFVFGPYDIHSANAAEFPVSFAAALRHLVPWALGAVAALAVVLLLAGRRAFEAGVALALAASIALYIQGKWLLWDYGLFDGQAIDWSAHPWRSVIDAAIWISLGVGFLHFRRRVVESATGIAALIVAAQVASAVPALLRDGPAQRGPNHAELESIHRYSADRNVVVLLLDAFQGTAFTEILASEPAWAGRLDGFTLFRDAIAPFPTTKLSLPAMLSGALYDNSISMRAFLSAALPERSLPSLLSSRGYLVDVTTRARFCEMLRVASCAELAPRVERDVHRLERRSLAQLMEVSLFRQSPQTLKRVLRAHAGWLVRGESSDRRGPAFHVDSIRFVEGVEANARLGAGAPTFKFLHLFIPHPPLRLDDDCGYTEGAEPASRAAYLSQSRCALSLMRRYLAVLERLGVYDESLVVVVADHGVDLDLDWGLPSKPGYPHLGPALPLLLVKPFAARGELEIRDAPASIADIPHSIANALGIEHRFPGRSLFELGEAELRPRVHRDYRWKRSHWWGLNIDHMQEYVIRGPARDGQSWTRGRELPAAGVERRAGGAP